MVATMKMVMIFLTTMINPDHISQIVAMPDRHDSAYVIYVIHMNNGLSHEIRLREYWNEYYPYNALAAAHPRLIGALNGENVTR
jgi:hypothetical protein